MISTQAPAGFRDFINRSARRRWDLMQKISEVYSRFGFLPVETPACERLEVLEGSGGGENEKLIFKIMKRGEKLQESFESARNTRQVESLAEYGLRFDMTVPLARLACEYRNDIHLPWKVFHIGPVWRAERAQKGRFREFIQADADILGSSGIGAEMDVLQAGIHAVNETGMTGFELRINDRRFLKSFAASQGIQADRVNAFLIELDKKDKMPANDLLIQLKEFLGAEPSRELRALLDNSFSVGDVEKFSAEAFNDIEELMDTLGRLNLPIESILFDPSLARGLGYYTGPIFELRHKSAGYSFGGGGRYDNLLSRFSNQGLPAVGFSLGFDRIFMLLEERDSTVSHANRLFIPLLSEDLKPACFEWAARLRKNTWHVDVFPEASKLAKQFKFASALGHAWALVIGADEIRTGEFKLKNLAEQVERKISEKELMNLRPTSS